MWLVSLLLSGAAVSEPAAVAVVQSATTELKPLRFGTFSHPPYAYRDADGNYIGSLYEAGLAILKQSGLPGHNRVLPPRRLWQQLINRQTDCAMMINNQTTSSTFQMVAPLGQLLTVGILPRAGIALNRYEDLQNLRIAVPRALHIDGRFDQDGGLHKVATRNYYHSALMMKRNRVDAMAGGIESMLFNAHQQGMSPRELGKPLVFNRLPIWLLCARDSVAPGVIARLQQATAVLRKAGRIEQVFQRHRLRH